MLKLIFCKIEDERSKVLEFFATPDELGGDTAAAPARARLAKLMTEKVVARYPTIFTGRDREIDLKANVVAYVVAQLQRYSLLKSAVDVKGVAYEEVVGSNLRGDRGEFFTPRNACRMAVAMLDPREGEALFDPACGTDGFLITAMNHALGALDRDERAKWADPDRPTREEEAERLFRRADYLRKRAAGLDLNLGPQARVRVKVHVRFGEAAGSEEPNRRARWHRAGTLNDGGCSTCIPGNSPQAASPRLTSSSARSANSATTAPRSTDRTRP